MSQMACMESEGPAAFAAQGDWEWAWTLDPKLYVPVTKQCCPKA